MTIVSTTDHDALQANAAFRSNCRHRSGSGSTICVPCRSANVSTNCACSRISYRKNTRYIHTRVRNDTMRADAVHDIVAGRQLPVARQKARRHQTTRRRHRRLQWCRSTSSRYSAAVRKLRAARQKARRRLHQRHCCVSAHGRPSCTYVYTIYITTKKKAICGMVCHSKISHERRACVASGQTASYYYVEEDAFQWRISVPPGVLS